MWVGGCVIGGCVCGGGGVQMAPDYLPLKTKQTTKNLIGVKIKICPKTEN